MSAVTDVASTAGKSVKIAEHIQLLVVGAGPAGSAAAIEAARMGASVVLVDEHPVDPALMAMDVPFHFGQRMNPSVSSRGRVVEQLLEAEQLIAEAFECGVEVRLGTAVWGLFIPEPGLRWLEKRTAGLTDYESSWYVSFDAVVLATGRRDVGVAFPGWESPGVMGVAGAWTLLHKYAAFEGNRIVIVGTGAEAEDFAVAALQAGLTIAAAVDASSLEADPATLARWKDIGVPVFARSTIARAVSGALGITGVLVAPLKEGGGLSAGDTVAIECDTIVLATGVAPVVELFDVAGAELTYSTGAGGFVPRTGPEGQTTVPMVFGVGDCVSVSPERSSNRALVEEDGRRVARAALRSLGLIQGDRCETPVSGNPEAARRAETRLLWAQATLATCAESTSICQCEEVAAFDLLGTRLPRYLAEGAGRDLRPVSALAVDGAVSQDQVKRLTRAGMGVCQGRRCREQVGAIIAHSAGVPISQMPPPTYRAPVRPLPLSVFADPAEDPSITDNWEGWFGIEAQWIPFWELDGGKTK